MSESSIDAVMPQQEEMPFAVVQGQPQFNLPKDLYIPPDALEVFLDAFEGPLDLLLYLIRRQNLDILDIPIADITRQYMEYIELMTDLRRTDTNTLEQINRGDRRAILELTHLSDIALLAKFAKRRLQR